MDRLFQRYAYPFPFMDGMILTGRFDSFVADFIAAENKEIAFKNEEKEMQFHLDVFLHRVFDKSFKDYLDEIKNNQENMEMTKTTIETTVQHSMDILHRFNPERGE
jgi:hypothetical protein